MHDLGSRRVDYDVFLPSVSVLAQIPETLKQMLFEMTRHGNESKRTLLVSSNALANKFILTHWGLRPAQRRYHRHLFIAIRRHCRKLFQHYLSRGYVTFELDGLKLHWGVFLYDRVRGNLILGFVHVPDDDPFRRPPP